MSQTLLSLAGFQVILIGRFWVIAEVIDGSEYPSAVKEAAISSIEIAVETHDLTVVIDPGW